MSSRWLLEPQPLADALALGGLTQDPAGLLADLPSPSPDPATALKDTTALTEGAVLHPELQEVLAIMAAPRSSLAISVAPAGGETSFANYRFFFNADPGPFVLAAHGDDGWDLAYLPNQTALLVVIEDLLLGDPLPSQHETHPPAHVDIQGLAALAAGGESDWPLWSMDFATLGAVSKRSDPDSILRGVQQLAEVGLVEEKSKFSPRGERFRECLHRLLRTVAVQFITRTDNGGARGRRVVFMRSPEALLELRWPPLDHDGPLSLRELSIAEALRSLHEEFFESPPPEAALAPPPPMPEEPPTPPLPPPLAKGAAPPPPLPKASAKATKNVPQLVLAALGLTSAVFLVALVPAPATNTSAQNLSGSGNPAPPGDPKSTVIPAPAVAVPPGTPGARPDPVRPKPVAQKQSWVTRQSIDDLNKELAAANQAGNHCTVAGGRDGSFFLGFTSQVKMGEQFLVAGSFTQVAEKLKALAPGEFRFCAVTSDGKGRWLAVVAKGLAPFQQAYAIGNAAHVQQAIEDYWKQDYRVTDLAAENGSFITLLQSKSGIGFQTFHFGTWEETDKSIRESWAKKHSVTALALDRDQWFVILSEDSSVTKQTYRAPKNNTELKAEVSAAWKDNFNLTTVAGHPSAWVVVVSQGPIDR